jgi:hypothetical protein
MKALVTVLTILLCTHALQARLGETEAEIKARYGDGQLSDIQRQPGAQTFKHFKNGFQIEVVISQGKSVWEIMQRQGGSGEFPEADIKNILDGYKKEMKRSWRFDRRDNRWESAGKPKYVAYLWPDHEDFFCIKDLTACDELDKAAPGSKGL